MKTIPLNTNGVYVEINRPLSGDEHSVLYYRHLRLRLSAGSADSIHVFREAAKLYVVSLNDRLDYVGLELFSVIDGSPRGNVFFQGREQWRYPLGPRGLDLSPIHIAKRLHKYAMAA